MIEHEPKKTYYQLNKDKWKKGGKYYNYKPIGYTRSNTPLIVERGKFIISFD